MIWVRRFFAVLLAVLFVPVFISVLLLLRVNSTVRNPEFYVSELRKADVYSFAHDSVLPAAFDEAAKGDDLPVDIKPLREEVLSGAREILPPDWLQEQTENAIREVVPYVVGDADSFSVTIPLQERVEAASAVLKKNVREGDAFPIFYNQVVDRVGDQAAPKGTLELPMGITLKEAEVEGYVRRVIPQDWVRARMEQSITELTPYVAGRSDTFRVTIPLTDRVEPTAAVLKEVLGKANTYDFVLQQMVMPIVEKNVGTSVDVAFGAKLTRAEIVNAVQQVLTRDWMAKLQSQVVDQAVSYLTGTSPTFAVTVPLGDRKQAAYQALTTLIDQRLAAQYQALPVCTLQQVVSLNLQANTMPPCRPPGATYEAVKQAAGIDLPKEIAKVVGGQVPDQWVFTEADLRNALGSGGVETLDKGRGWIKSGITFTEADLKKALEPGQLQDLDKIRKRIREGITFTEADLQKLLEDGGSRESFESVRNAFAMMRWIPLVGLAVLAILLALIGLLGGRSWGSRLAWAGSVLLVASVVVLGAIFIGYSGVARPQIEQALADAVADANGVAGVMMERAGVLALNVLDDFVGGLRLEALVSLVLAGAALGGGIYLQAARRQRLAAGGAQRAPEETLAGR